LTALWITAFKKKSTDYSSSGGANMRFFYEKAEAAWGAGGNMLAFFRLVACLKQAPGKAVLS
jgi:hypothetical protein